MKPKIEILQNPKQNWINYLHYSVVVNAVTNIPDEVRNADFKHAESELEELLALFGL